MLQGAGPEQLIAQLCSACLQLAGCPFSHVTSAVESAIGLKGDWAKPYHPSTHHLHQPGYQPTFTPTIQGVSSSLGCKHWQLPVLMSIRPEARTSCEHTAKTNFAGLQSGQGQDRLEMTPSFPRLIKKIKKADHIRYHMYMR